MPKPTKPQANEAIRGFTLIEVLVVIAIISLLSSVVFVSLSQARVKARDSKRVQDLVQLRNALELYYSKNGRYPPRVSSGGAFVADCWDCSNGTEVCEGENCNSFHFDGNRLADLKDYLDPRPTDPLEVGNKCGYWYLTNDAGTDYKVGTLTRAENVKNIPTQFLDTYIGSTAVIVGCPLPRISISVYSSGAKCWTVIQRNDCL